MTIYKKIYNLKSFEDAHKKALRFKDSGGIVLARNLEHVSSEIFTQEYPDLTFLMSGIDVNSEGSGATSVRKLKLAIEGSFRENGVTSSAYGKISLSGEDESLPVFFKDAESSWTELELLQADRQQINLADRYLSAHNELYNREIDRLGYLGQVRSDGTQKTTGLLNSAFTTASASGTAAALSGDALYNEIASVITDQWNSVLNVATYKADRVVMPAPVYNACFRKVLNSAGSAMTVMSALVANFPTVQFITTPLANSVSGTSRTVAFSTNRRAMQMRIPDPLRISNVWNLGSRYGFDSYFGIVGLDVIESGAGRILTGL
jgi:hypothetical protein